MILPLDFSGILVRAFTAAPFLVAGNSMAPTLKDRQRVLAYPPGPGTGDLPRGALVVLRHPVLPGQIYIKRIIGLPAETFRIDGHRVYIDDDDTPLSEPYLAPGQAGNSDETPHRETARLWITDPDEYFVLGDRRDDSQDSRSFGPVHHDLILGRVWLRYWPLQAVGVLTNR